jgi:putative glycosyltransferase (TIGR04348 family)
LAPPAILIVTPYAPAANNGNVRTAERWAQLLQPRCRAIVRTPDDAPEDADLLIALHARRSHGAVRAWRERHARRPLVVTLTGTDLYRDLPGRDADAIASLEQADRLIVLQERGIAALPERFRKKARAIHQSSPTLPAYAKSNRRLRTLFVGHLRAEKDPFTFLRAAGCLRDRSDIEFAIVGGMRDRALERPTRALLARAPGIRMLGALSHRATRERIRRAHLLVVPSRMEGGANVIVEAITSGTPVLASDCDGNLGMLGDDYAGIFAVQDHRGLARLLERCRSEPAFLQRLSAQCAARLPRFTPAAERRGLLDTIEPLLAARVD